MRNPETLGQFIRKGRLEQGLLAKELAKQIGCDENSLIQWEKDYRFPELRHLRKLHAYFNIPAPFIREAVINRSYVSQEEKPLLFEFESLIERLKACLVNVGKGREHILHR